MNITSDIRHSDTIIAEAAYLYDVDPDDITGRSRRPEVCQARWAVMAALEQMGWSTVRIGRRLNRDHTTVLYGLGRVGL